jgi:hypothetical protein
MDVCTRPSHTSRQMRGPSWSRLAASLCCAGLLIGTPVTAATAPDLLPTLAPENEATATISPSAQHEVSIKQVQKGQEMAVLTARLTDASDKTLSNAIWQVKNSAGDVVYDKAAATAAMALMPGYYTVELRSGRITLQETFTLLEGHKLTIGFVLNSGALRVLPRIKGLATPDLSTDTLIYALQGNNKGNLVSRSTTPGEVINLTAGQYRIESRLKIGNALAVIDVKVQPGIMSAVEVDHRAGLARLSYVGAPDATVNWMIKRGPVTEIDNLSGLNASVVLRPGKYIAIAKVGNERLTASFQIEEGQARDIMLGN